MSYSTIEKLQNEFQLRDGLIYLNHAGVSPWPVRTANAVRRFADENMVQGSYDYLKWIQTETGLRIQAQELLNAPSKDDIGFLKNTSEALSVVAYGIDWKNGDNIISSDQEFPSNRIVWESLSTQGVEFRKADLYSAESPEAALLSRVDANTRLITISSVQYSTGLKMNLAQIGEFCRERGILFCVDAIQSLGAVRFDVQNVQADFVMADGHKWLLGPEGLALFYTTPKARNLLSLKQFGWHMVEHAGDFDRKEWEIAKSARMFECGSQNTTGIHALNASLSLFLEAGMENIEKEVLSRTEYLFEKIEAAPDLELITPVEKDRYAGIVTLCHKRADNEALYKYLTENNAVCSLRGGGIRLSPHFYTPIDDLDKIIDMIKSF